MKLLTAQYHRISLMINQHWLRWWLDGVRQPSGYKPLTEPSLNYIYSINSCEYKSPMTFITWINVGPSMDKKSHAHVKCGMKLFSIPKPELQRLHGQPSLSWKDYENRSWWLTTQTQSFTIISSSYSSIYSIVCYRNREFVLTFNNILHWTSGTKSSCSRFIAPSRR